MQFHHVDHLPVVRRDNPKELVGILTRTDIMAAMNVRGRPEPAGSK